MKERMMKRILYLVVIALVLILGRTAMADNKTVAQELIKNKLDSVISVLQQKELGKQSKDEQVINIVTPIFDFSLMAKLALGRNHWTGLTSEQKQRYTDLFVKRLKETYLEKINLYTDEELIYQTPVEENRKVQVPTQLISKGSKISMLYKLYQSQDGWKIYDVEVEGVSIVQTYRSQFDQILSTGNYDDLMAKLEHPESASATPAQTSAKTAGQQTK
jgi:phospholipid transport system substrate-binding protein